MRRINKRPSRRRQRQAEAAARQAIYDALHPNFKIQRALDAPGNSARQLRRLGVSA